MKPNWPALLVLGLLSTPPFAAAAAAGDDPSTAVLPPGVRAVWDAQRAHRERTPARERICVNGLWKWQPADAAVEKVPTNRWGYFKVPGNWPGATDYMQENTQRVYSHPSWKERRLNGVTAAWYEREIEIPSSWAGRRITLDVEYLNSFASVFVDGEKLGVIRFPAGGLELTSVCAPGSRHRLSLLVAAMPLEAVRMSFSDTNSAKTVKGSVARRGLCGDVYLSSEPADERIGDLRIDTSVRKWQIQVQARLDGLTPGSTYFLDARVQDGTGTVKRFRSHAFQLADLRDGQVQFGTSWHPQDLWDTVTPGNQYELTLSLLAGEKTLDASYPERFGFREFWIDGRDFYLNGSRIHLSAVPLDNAQMSPAAATYSAAKETLSRMKRLGVNFVYTHNYGCEPGSHLSFAGILRAADEAGMLVALSQPHFGQYKWRAADADQNNGYARDAAFYARVAASHPSVVMYSTSHNATGYVEGNNPDMIDGIQDPRTDSWSRNGANLARRAEAIIRRIDPSRIVYHHSGGNLGAIYSLNFYTNFTPIQEMSDWFEHWATKGVKPLFTCEYAVPMTWDWTMYRGWYRGVREFGSAVVPWEYCVAEWSAQFLGDGAYRISEAEKTNLRWEAKKFQSGGGWHRWDYPHQVGSTVFDQTFAVIGRYIHQNWRALRTWGLSANNFWEYAYFWTSRPGSRRARKEFPVDWDALQRPGFSPDFSERPFENIVTSREFADWDPNEAGKALLRNNQPLLAYIAGKPASFTSGDHNFNPGENVEKQLIIINDARHPVEADCEWSVNLPEPVRGRRKVSIPTGDRRRIPLQLTLPALLPAGRYTMSAVVRFSTGESQTDNFDLNVMPAPAPVKDAPRMAVFDPRGETLRLLETLGVSVRPVGAEVKLGPEDILVIGKGALTLDGPGPDVRRLRDGLKVIVFEQSGDVLEKRLGFRITEYGLRQVFRRVPDHPLLEGLDEESLRDWRGEATILPPRLKYTIGPAYQRTAPVVQWCGLDVTRAWRCGCRGNVASVLIEKPAKGDFLPVLDGGFSLQYSPLMEYREGRGMVLFCQTDVTGRTERDPAAERLVCNIVRYVAGWKPAPRREVLYAGGLSDKRHLGFTVDTLRPYRGGALGVDKVLVVDSDGARSLAENKTEVVNFLQQGGHLLALGLDEKEANAMLPFSIQSKRAEHISVFFKPPSKAAPFAGIGPADLHNRDPREIPLITGGAEVVGNGVLAWRQGSNVVFFQFPPWSVIPSGPGENEAATLAAATSNLRRTYRRASYTLNRLLANMGAAAATPLADRIHKPLRKDEKERRWIDGFYLDQPQEWDDPYRFFNW